MAITRAQVSTPEGLAAWLNENAGAFFSSVTQNGNQDYTVKDLDGNAVFRFSYTQFMAYRTNGANSISIPNGATGLFGTTDIIMCDNGIILDTSYSYNISRKFGLLISPTNNNKLAIIFSYGGTTTTSSNYLYTQLQHVALGDSTTISTTTTFTPETAQQTTLCPFGTNADVGTASYTTDAYYMPMGQNYNSGIAQFSIGNDHFITNGYWSIRTGGDE